MHFVRGSTWIYIDPAPGNLKGIITDFQESQFGCGSFHHLQLFILTCYLIASSFQRLIHRHHTAEPEIVKLFLRGETASCCTASEADEVSP